jgi:DNA-binding CsgD family transcriptional regulator
MFLTEWDRQGVLLAECEEIAEGLDDPLLDARIKECRGHATLYAGRLPEAMAMLEQACADFRAIGDPLGEFDTLILLTGAGWLLGDPRIGEFSRQAHDLADRHGALSAKAYGLWSVGVAQWQAGDIAAATRSLRDSVRLFLTMHDVTGISFGIQALSLCAAFDSPDAAAARLLGASQAAWRTSGARVEEPNAYGMFDTRAVNLVRAAVGSAVFDDAFAEGAGYSFEQAVALALGPDAEGHDGIGATQSADSLTRREREVAALLAEGLSNREIAERLVISLRTAETHVDRILGKLGFTSRTRVASWFAEHGTK